MRRTRAVAGTLVLLAVLTVVLYPLLWMVGTSLKGPKEVLNNLGAWPHHVTWKNFSDGWNGLPRLSFGRFFLNTVVLAAMVVVANVVSCTLAGYAFARLRFPLRRFWFTLMIGTLLLPHHVLIVPQFVLFRALHWTNSTLPLVVPKLLGTEAFFVFLVVQFMRGIPPELDEAARIDGCSSFRVFWRVVLPLSRPAMVTIAIFSFIWTWNDFFSQLVYLSDPRKYTVSLGLRLFLDSGGQSAVGPMFAMSVLSLLPVFLFFLAFQRLLVEGVTTTGLKG
jgi:multiple sugar transport system permease protein